MTLQVRQFGSRLLLILALAAALLADIVTIQWVTSHSSLSQVVFTSIGNDSGGGKICPVGSLGGDSGEGDLLPWFGPGITRDVVRLLLTGRRPQRPAAAGRYAGVGCCSPPSRCG
jgi:hypothetical protein